MRNLVHLLPPSSMPVGRQLQKCSKYLLRCLRRKCTQFISKVTSFLESLLHPQAQGHCGLCRALGLHPPLLPFQAQPLLLPLRFPAVVFPINLHQCTCSVSTVSAFPPTDLWETLLTPAMHLSTSLSIRWRGFGCRSISTEVGMRTLFIFTQG